MAELNIESPVRSHILSMEDKYKIYSRVKGDLDAVSPEFNLKIEARDRNYDFYANRQWTDDELVAHTEQFRHAYQFNEILNKVDHLKGTETQTRLDSRCVAREPGDEPGVELLNFLLKWAEQVNDIEYIQSEIFEESLVGGSAAALVRWENEDMLYGFPKIEKVPMRELYWDLNAKQSNLDDCRWMARVFYVTRLDAKEMFPGYTSVIDKSSSKNINVKYNILTDRQERILSTGILAPERDRDLVEIIEYYEKIRTYVYTVVDDIGGTLQKFNDRQEAEYYYQGLMDQYITDGADIILPDGRERVIIVETGKDTIWQTIVIGDEVVTHNLTALPWFPYCINFAYFSEGDYWGFVDALIDPQILINRFFSQWDYQLGTGNKGIMTVMESMLQRPFNIEDLRRESTRTNPIIPVTSHLAIQNVQNEPVNPEYFQGINFSITRMNDYAGGRNVLGYQENAAESGRAVIARAEQGGIARLPFFDRLRLWRKGVTLRLTWWLKNYMTPNQQLRIIGIDKDVQYMDIDDSVIGSLRELRYDIEIDEVIKSESLKEQYFQQYRELVQVAGVPIEIATPMLVELSLLPKSIKEKILSQLDYYVEYNAKKEEERRQQKMQQEVIDSVQKKQMKEAMLRGEEVEQAEDDLKKQEKDLKTQMDKVDKIREEISSNNLGPVQRNIIFDKLRTPEEMKERTAASLQGDLM